MRLGHQAPLPRVSLGVIRPQRSVSMLKQTFGQHSVAFSVPCSQHTPLVHRAATKQQPVIVAGLKKETKKLAKTLKSHRKRLDVLLAAQQAPAGAPAAALQQMSTAELHAVMAEIAQLQTALAAVRQHQRRLVAADAGCSDTSSDSDQDCFSAQQQVQQLEVSNAAAAFRQSDRRVAARETAAATSGSSVVCLQAPAIDQEFLDVCQQLPPPQQYSAQGRVLVCQGKACMRKGALQVLHAVSHATSASPELEVLPCKCLGKCKQGPAMRVRIEEQLQSSLVTEIEPAEVPTVLEQLLC